MRGPQPWKTERSRVLRSKPIAAEAKLWRQLRGRQLNGFKFIRQAAIGPYFVDFLCREQKLIVEADGGTHSTEEEKKSDNERTEAFEALGYRIFRVDNNDIYNNMESVLDALLAKLGNGAGPLSP